jgi:hypothetical protein
MLHGLRDFPHNRSFAGSPSWLGLSEQFFGFDNWNLCRGDERSWSKVDRSHDNTGKIYRLGVYKAAAKLVTAAHRQAAAAGAGKNSANRLYCGGSCRHCFRAGSDYIRAPGDRGLEGRKSFKD